MINTIGSATLEVKLTRSSFDSLVQRLGEADVSLRISRGRFTPKVAWVRLEITGEKSRVDEAHRLFKRSS